MRATAQRLSVLALGLGLLAGSLTGCASPDSSSGATPSQASTTVSPAPEVFEATSASQVFKWDDVSATLSPWTGSTTSLVTSTVAYSAVSEGVTNVAGSPDASGTPTASLYSYTNSAYGDIQTDGSVKLTYTDSPVWAFTIPLARYVDLSQGPKGASAPSPVTRSGCEFYYLVSASDGSFVTSGEECSNVQNSIQPTSPAK